MVSDSSVLVLVSPHHSMHQGDTDWAVLMRSLS